MNVIFRILIFIICTASGVKASEYDTLATLDYSRPDSLAENAPLEATLSMSALVAHLTQGEPKELFRFRAIFRWITLNINYDVQSAMTGRFKDNSSSAVLQSRLAVCEGYSNLFRDLCRIAQIECELIKGYGKGFNYKIGQKILKPEGHAWNAVKINGKWFLTDITWATGYIHNGKFVRYFTPFYFLTDPTYFIWTHFPAEVKWQLLEKPIGITTFEQLPHTLFIHDFKPVAPLSGTVSKNSLIEIKIIVPRAESVIAIGGSEVILLDKKEGNLFTGIVKPVNKELSIGVRVPENPPGKHDIVMIYLVK